MTEPVASWRRGTRRAVAGALAAAALSIGSAGSPPDPDPVERAIRSELRRKQGELEERLERFVAINTGSFHLAGLERFAATLSDELDALGFAVDLQPGPTIALPGRGPAKTGPIVVARRSARAADGRTARILLVGHMDTIFPPDTEFREMRRIAERPGYATGPGVIDMKGGLVAMLAALEALAGHGILDAAEWTVLLNSDEEIGSLGSRPVIETEARRATHGFVFEPADRGGAMVRSRRGLGQFHLAVTGVGAHAGAAHREGRSAIRELADKVLRIEALTDYDAGVTLNVGTISGGIKRNVVPPRAEAWVDLRYEEPDQGEQVRARIATIADDALVPDTSTEVWGRLHRPPKRSTPGVEALLALHRDVAEDAGVEIPEARHSGGGTDGSIMGHVGLATLDTLGPVGGGPHTDREYIALESLSERAALAAVLLHRVAVSGASASPVDAARAEP